MNAKPQPRKSGSSSLASSLASSAAVITPEEISGPGVPVCAGQLPAVLVRVHRGRKGERRSMSELNYAGGLR